jgi:hypothetical protein
MKFKMTLHGEGLGVLKNAVQIFAGLSQTCTLSMEPDALRLISVSQKSSLRVYANLRSNLVTTRYVVKSRASNVVNVEVNCRSLLSALRSAEASSPDATVVKLTQRSVGQPALTFEIREMTGTCTITQDVPVVVLTRDQVEADREPRAPPPQVQLEMGDVKGMLKVVDTLRTIDSQLRIHADNRGTLTIGVASPMASMTTFYHDLIVRTPSSSRSRGGARASAVVVDASTFRTILQCSAASPTSTMCCISDDSSLVFHVALRHGGATLTYYCAVQAVVDEQPAPRRRERERERGRGGKSRRRRSADRMDEEEEEKEDGDDDRMEEEDEQYERNTGAYAQASYSS